MKCGHALAAGVEEESYVEYDLDSEDEAWLADLNKDQQRLSATQFERFLDTLEHANVAANIRADGGGPLSALACHAHHPRLVKKEEGCCPSTA